MRETGGQKVNLQRFMTDRFDVDNSIKTSHSISESEKSLDSFFDNFKKEETIDRIQRKDYFYKQARHKEKRDERQQSLYKVNVPLNQLYHVQHNENLNYDLKMHESDLSVHADSLSEESQELQDQRKMVEMREI